MMKSAFVLVAFVVVPVWGQASHRALPDDNLAYPVLISMKGSTGSGFFLNTPKATYLVTAKHVLFDDAGKLHDPVFSILSYSKDLSDTTPNLVNVDTSKLGMQNAISHPARDVAIVKISTVSSITEGKRTMNLMPGMTPIRVAKQGIVGVGLDTILKFDDVLVGNSVIILGYPTSLSLQSMPEIDIGRPLLRKGIVAGKNLAMKAIILDCPVYFGNSGGPAVEMDEQDAFARAFRIIGVISKYVPYSDGGKTFAIVANSGYSVITPMDFVLELVAKAEKE